MIFYLLSKRGKNSVKIIIKKDKANNYLINIDNKKLIELIYHSFEKYSRNFYLKIWKLINYIQMIWF